MKPTERILGLFLLLLVGAALGGCRTGLSPHDQLRTELELRKRRQEQSQELYELAKRAIARADSESARDYLSRAVKSDKRNAKAWMLLGKVEAEDARLYEAAKAFHSAGIAMPTRYEPHYNLGWVFEAAGQPSRAAAEYEKALELSPGQLEVMENLARCYIECGQEHERAARLIERSLKMELRPDWVRWLQNEQRKLATQIGRAP